MRQPTASFSGMKGIKNDDGKKDRIADIDTNPVTDPRKLDVNVRFVRRCFESVCENRWTGP